MKITKEYLKEVIKEELQTEMFGLDGAQVANVMAGNFAYDVACALAGIVLFGAARIAGAAVGAIGEYITTKAHMERMAKQSEMIKNIANKVRGNKEVLELVKQRKLKLASQKMAEVGLLTPQEKAYCKAVYDLMKSEMGMEK